MKNQLLGPARGQTGAKKLEIVIPGRPAASQRVEPGIQPLLGDTEDLDSGLRADEAWRRPRNDHLFTEHDVE